MKAEENARQVEVKRRIRHYLLQQSKQYLSQLKRNLKTPPIMQMARDLDSACGLGVRRIQKFLSEKELVRDLAVTVWDLEKFASLSDQPVGSFVSYLLNERQDSPLKDWETETLAFFARLPLSTRRNLKLTVFRTKDTDLAKNLIEQLIKLSQLREEDLIVVETIIESLLAVKKR